MIYGAQPTGIMATMPMPAQAAMGQFAITDPDSPMGIESLAGGQEELAERLRAMGVPQYGLGKLFRKVVPKELRKVASVVLPTVMTTMFGPMAGAATSATLTKLEGGSTEDALFSAGTAYLGGKIGGNLSGAQKYAAQAALSGGVAKLRGAETDDALRAGLKAAAGSFVGEKVGGMLNSRRDMGTIPNPEGIAKGIGSLPGARTTPIDEILDPAALGDVAGTGDTLLTSELMPTVSVERVGISAPDFAQVATETMNNLSNLPQNALDSIVSGETTPDQILQDIAGEKAINVVSESGLLTPGVEAGAGAGAGAGVASVTPDSDLNFMQRFTKKLGEGTDDFIDDITLQNSFKDFVGAASIPVGGLALLGGMLSADEMEEVRKLSPEQQELIIQQMLGTSGDPSYAEGAKQFGEFYKQRRETVGLNDGGEIVGPGTGTSDSVPALLSDGEFVMTAKAVRNAGGGNREKGAAKMYALMNKLEKGAA